MTLFTTLLVLIAERLFKLGEHWQLDPVSYTHLTLPTKA